MFGLVRFGLVRFCLAWFGLKKKKKKITKYYPKKLEKRGKLRKTVKSEKLCLVW